jgi:hypothetical protein
MRNSVGQASAETALAVHSVGLTQSELIKDVSQKLEVHQLQRAIASNLLSLITLVLYIAAAIRNLINKDGPFPDTLINVYSSCLGVALLIIEGIFRGMRQHYAFFLNHKY